MPTPTDLVTDLPADFEVFGQAVDSTMADLKGGTSGQILSKNSNTDMDFVWTTPNPGDITGVTAGTGISGGGTSGDVTITNSMATEITAKGDLIVGTGSATFDNLAVGANGSILLTDSSTTTGLRYQASQAAGKNVIINGNFDIWQRGTSFTGVATGAYTADRWKATLTATGLSCNITQDTSVPNSSSKYSIKVLQATNATSVGEYEVRTLLETSQILQLCGTTTTVSFWYRSNLTGTHAARLYASPMTGGTDVAQSFTVSAANTWEKKVLTFSSFAGVTSPSTAWNVEAAGLSIGFNVFGSASRSTLAANDYFQIDQVMLETGSVNTSFTRAGGNTAGELAACLRYYQRQMTSSVRMGTGFAASTSAGQFVIALPAAMRIAPTSMEYGGTIVWFDGVGGNGVGTMTLVNASPVSAGIAFTGSSGLTQYRPLGLSGNSADAYLAFNAEL